MKRLGLALLLVIASLSATRLVASPQESSQIEQVRRILRQASQLVESIPQQQQPSVAPYIANTQARAGDLAGALTTAHRLKEPHALAEALDSIAYAVDYAGDLDSALNLIRSSADGPSTTNSYRGLAVAHAVRGDFLGAAQIAHLIERNPNTLGTTLIDIAKEEWKSGDHAAAQRTFDEAFAVAEQVRKDDPSLDILMEVLAMAQAEIGETSAASATLSHFSALIDQSTDAGGSDVPRSFLTTGFGQIHDFARALRIVDTLSPGSNRDTALQVIASQLFDSGNTRDAMETVAKISDAQQRAAAMGSFATIQAHSGNAVAGRETANSIASAPARASALATVALEQAERGDEGAWYSVHLAWEDASKSTGTVPPHVFETIAVTRAILGDFAGAQEILHRLDPEARVWSLWNITKVMAFGDNSADALDLAANEDSAHPKASALLGTAQGMLDRIRKESKEKFPER